MPCLLYTSLDFNKMIYGEELQIFSYKFLRSEKKFESVDELQAQIAVNAEQTRAYFASAEYEHWKAEEEK